MLNSKIEFKKIFKQPLDYFMLPAGLGFDIVKFDDYIKTPDGISCKNWTIQQYGQQGLSLINQLLNLEGGEIK